jgi:hypothetical protein
MHRQEMPTDDLIAQAKIAQRLTHKYPEVDPGTVSTAVNKRYEQLDDSAIRDFVPVLVEHAVADDIRTHHGEFDS